MRRSLVSDALLFHGTAQHVSLLARRPLVFSTVAQIKKASRISHHARCGVAATKLPAPFGGAPAQEKNGFRSGAVFVQYSSKSITLGKMHRSHHCSLCKKPCPLSGFAITVKAT